MRIISHNQHDSVVHSTSRGSTNEWSIFTGEGTQSLWIERRPAIGGETRRAAFVASDEWCPGQPGKMCARAAGRVAAIARWLRRRFRQRRAVKRWLRSQKKLVAAWISTCKDRHSNGSVLAGAAGLDVGLTYAAS